MLEIRHRKTGQVIESHAPEERFAEQFNQRSTTYYARQKRPRLTWLVGLCVFSCALAITVSCNVATREVPVQIVKEAYSAEELKERELKRLKMLAEIEMGKAEPDLESLNVQYFLAGLMPPGYIPPAFVPDYVQFAPGDLDEYTLRDKPLENAKPAKFKKARHTKSIEASKPILSNPHPWANLLRAT